MGQWNNRCPNIEDNGTIAPLSEVVASQLLTLRARILRNPLILSLSLLWYSCQDKKTSYIIFYQFTYYIYIFVSYFFWFLTCTVWLLSVYSNSHSIHPKEVTTCLKGSQALVFVILITIYLYLSWIKVYYFLFFSFLLSSVYWWNTEVCIDMLSFIFNIKVYLSFHLLSSILVINNLENLEPLQDCT